MSKKAHVLHVLFVALTGIGALLVEALSPGGSLAHYQWSVPALGAVVYLLRLAGVQGPPAATAAFLAVTLPLLGCSLFTHTPVGPTPPADAGTGTPGFVDCSEAAIHAAALTLLPDIATDLAMAPAASLAALEAGVATLAAQVGIPLATAEFGCAINWVLSKAQAQVATTADSTAAVQVANALAYFEAHPMTFAATGGAQ